MHWTQLTYYGRHQMFDWGSPKKNQQHYGQVGKNQKKQPWKDEFQTTPPLYDISKIHTDMYLYWSDQDYLADIHDIQNYLLKYLPKQVGFNISGIKEIWNINYLDLLFHNTKLL